VKFNLYQTYYSAVFHTVVVWHLTTAGWRTVCWQLLNFLWYRQCCILCCVIWFLSAQFTKKCDVDNTAHLCSLRSSNLVTAIIMWYISTKHHPSCYFCSLARKYSIDIFKHSCIAFFRCTFWIQWMSAVQLNVGFCVFAEIVKERAGCAGACQWSCRGSVFVDANHPQFCQRKWRNGAIRWQTECNLQAEAERICGLCWLLVV